MQILCTNSYWRRGTANYEAFIFSKTRKRPKNQTSENTITFLWQNIRYGLDCVQVLQKHIFWNNIGRHGLKKENWLDLFFLFDVMMMLIVLKMWCYDIICKLWSSLAILTKRLLMIFFSCSHYSNHNLTFYHIYCGNHAERAIMI